MGVDSPRTVRHDRLVMTDSALNLGVIQRHAPACHHSWPSKPRIAWSESPKRANSFQDTSYEYLTPWSAAVFTFIDTGPPGIRRSSGRAARSPADVATEKRCFAISPWGAMTSQRNGEPETSMRQAASDQRFPYVLPDGDVLFTLGDTGPDTGELHLLLRDTGEHRTLVPNAAAGALGRLRVSIDCRVAPGDCSPEALTRTGLGGFHHPALPLMWLMAMRPRFARESEARAEDIVPTTQRPSARGPLPFEFLVT